MTSTFGHVNIIASDWERLSRFYQIVFDCIPVPPKRDLSGKWLDSGTGLSGAHLQGEHLLLPGFGAEGPTLEIFSYSDMLEKPKPIANRLGIGHLAFQVPNVYAHLDQVIAHGGSACGMISSNSIPGKGTITFVYATDPEGNLIELQSWAPA